MILSSRLGFTLIETILTILLIAIMASVSLPNFMNLGDEARTATTKDRLAALKRGIVGDSRLSAGGVYTFPGFKADLGRLPTSLGELTGQGALSTYDPLNRTGWRGPYVDSSALTAYGTDAWGTAIVFSTSPQILRSWGPNKSNDAGASDDITLSY